MYSIIFVIIALLILTTVVVAHEFGHFIVAKKLGFGIEEFAVGMGPKLFSFTKNGIIYSLRLLPIGGYCRFVSEDEDSNDPLAFNNQKVWKRILTVLAGPVFNVILAFLICVALVAFNQVYEAAPKVYEVIENTPAMEAGLQPGDIITKINDTEISYNEAGIQELNNVITTGETAVLFVKRGDATEIAIEITPQYNESEGRYMVGIYFGTDITKTEWYNIIPKAYEFMADVTGQLVDGLKQLFVNLIKGILPKQGEVAGPVGIVSGVSQQVQTGFSMSFGTGIVQILFYVFVISLNLGIMNILPFPALDGGRFIFLLYEAIKGKKVNQNKIGIVNLIGFFVLLLLIFIITWSDIRALIVK